MVTKDYEGNALRAYRHLKTHNSENVMGRSLMQRVLTGFEGIELSDFEGIRPFGEIHSHMDHTNKSGLPYDEFLAQLVEKLGYDAQEPDMDEIREVGSRNGPGRYTEAAEHNRALLREYATEWAVERELSQADDEAVLEAGYEVENAIESLETAIERTDLDLDPEYSYDEQLGIRVRDALELLASINESMDAEIQRREG